MNKENLIIEYTNKKPSSDEWLLEAKKTKDASKVGMYLVHNGVVRVSAKEDLYQNKKEYRQVKSMELSVDSNKVEEVLQEAKDLKGLYYLRIWLNSGILNVGDDIMQVLIGSDTRDNCLNALNHVVSHIKKQCVKEKENY